MAVWSVCDCARRISLRHSIRFLGLIAERRANVMNIVHDRSHYGVPLGESVIELTLETRGRDHANEIIARATRRFWWYPI